MTSSPAGPAREEIVATYLIETPGEVEWAATAIAGEQSTGTFVKIPGETPEIHERHGGRVVELEVLDSSLEPALSNSAPVSSSYQRGRVKIAFLVENMGWALPNLMATVAGNLFELNQLSGVRLEDLDFPDSYIDRQPGARFGVPGTRELMGVADRPMVGTIIKPSVGLSPDATGELARSLAEAGIDFIKDDELMANPPHSPFFERFTKVITHLHNVSDTSGRLVMYAANVTDSLDDMRRNIDVVEEGGGTCVMVSVNHIGLTGLEAVRAHTTLPIHAHRNGWGALTREPMLGYSYTVWQKIWRLAGADHLHVNGLQNKFWEPDDSVIKSAKAVLSPLGKAPVGVPVFSSAQTALQAPETYALLQSTDILYVSGGGIMAHPDGPVAGLVSINEAWEAAISGVSLEEYARTHPALQAALSTFSSKK
jgi:ribulose-bisphosphate carboxylase large chain